MTPSIDLVVSQPTLLALQHNQIYEWRPWKETPHQLPWISFIRDTALLDSIRHTLFGGISRHLVSSSGSKYMLQFSHGQLGYGSSAIDKLAMDFSCLMPESREGENLDRARSLARTRGELDMEMLKVVLFQLSNNFIGWRDYKWIVRLVEVLGLSNRSIIRALFGVATNDLTIAAILDKLFIAACETSSLELAKALVQENKKLKNGQLVRVLAFNMLPALVISVIKQDVGIAKAIMDVPTECVIDHPWGNDAYDYDSRFWWELLECKNHQFTHSLLEILIPKIKFRQQFLDCLLFRALETGNTSLALKAIEYGADARTTKSSPTFHSWQESSWNRKSKRKLKTRRDIQILDSHTLYTACIVPLGQYNPESQILVGSIDE